VGRALARRLARDGYDLLIVSRDARDVEATAADLRLRFGIECWPFPQDIAESSWDVSLFAQTCNERLGGVNSLLVPAGSVAATDVGANPDVIDSVLANNYVGPARLAAAFGRIMAERGAGTIVLFSSIAAVAPRTKNPAYSAAKAALETYAAGLRHALSARGVEVLVVALGYVDTPQTFGLELPLPVASPDAVADHVLARLSRSSIQGGRRYYPRFWWWVTTCLRCIPWFIYRRLQF
jgi:NAD(P)-dependent dehydrogenase (short-subunit alcohol dehydrogenase family)